MNEAKWFKKKRARSLDFDPFTGQKRWAFFNSLNYALNFHELLFQWLHAFFCPKNLSLLLSANLLCPLCWKILNYGYRMTIATRGRERRWNYRWKWKTSRALFIYSFFFFLFFFFFLRKLNFLPRKIFFPLLTSKIEHVKKKNLRFLRWDLKS